MDSQTVQTVAATIQAFASIVFCGTVLYDACELKGPLAVLDLQHAQGFPHASFYILRHWHDVTRLPVLLAWFALGREPSFFESLSELSYVRRADMP
jgi:hypothetical protein